MKDKNIVLHICKNISRTNNSQSGTRRIGIVSSSFCTHLLTSVISPSKYFVIIILLSTLCTVYCVFASF